LFYKKTFTLESVSGFILGNTINSTPFISYKKIVLVSFSRLNNALYKTKNRNDSQSCALTNTKGNYARTNCIHCSSCPP